MRNIMQGYFNIGLGTAAGISGILATILLVVAIANDDYSIMGQSWCVGIPWSLCVSIAMPMAKAKVNEEILYPKGMHLQCYGCFAQKIVRAVPSLGSVGDAAQMGGVGALEGSVEGSGGSWQEGSVPDKVDFGKRERERTPANYGTVELTHSSKADEGEAVVRSMYAHISDGAARSERIIACNMKVVYVPEEDLLDLAQVYRSKQMGELRVRSQSEDGARRVLRFFYNNGSSLAAGSD